MKVKSLALGMILPLAASVALATAPTASAATPTKAAFTQSGVSAHGYGHRHRSHRGYYDRELNWNRNGYYPFAGPTFGGYGPVYNSFGLCKQYTGFYNYPYFLVPC